MAKMVLQRHIASRLLVQNLVYFHSATSNVLSLWDWPINESDVKLGQYYGKFAVRTAELKKLFILPTKLGAKELGFGKLTVHILPSLRTHSLILEALVNAV